MVAEELLRELSKEVKHMRAVSEEWNKKARKLQQLLVDVRDKVYKDRDAYSISSIAYLYSLLNEAVAEAESFIPSEYVRTHIPTDRKIQ